MSERPPMQQSADGSWQPAVPLGWQGSGPDFEVARVQGVYDWTAWDEDVCVARGQARTRLGLTIALIRAKRRLS